MRLYGLIGYPLGHSFSRPYFANKFEQEMITDCRYENFPLSSIDQLTEVLKQPGLAGFNITIPYKEAVLPFLDEADPVVKAMGACNCVKITNGRLKGYNTDIFGFRNTLLLKLQEHHRPALIIGTGGAAKAVAYVLDGLAIPYLFVSRTKRDGIKYITYEDIDETLLNEYLLLINTTPTGTFPNDNEAPALPYQYLGKSHYLFDLVYNPPQTLFLQKGAAMGALTQNGYPMLIDQAEESWRIWNEI
jgi:shikimate dehydrogenase